MTQTDIEVNRTLTKGIPFFFKDIPCKLNEELHGDAAIGRVSNNKPLIYIGTSVYQTVTQYLLDQHKCFYNHELALPVLPEAVKTKLHDQYRLLKMLKEKNDVT